MGCRRLLSYITEVVFCQVQYPEHIQDLFEKTDIDAGILVEGGSTDVLLTEVREGHGHMLSGGVAQDLY